MGQLHLGKRGAASTLALLSMTMPTGCAGEKMESYYVKESVQSVQVSKGADDVLSLRFFVQSESQYYPSGVNYEREGDTLRVAIDRCAIHGPCGTMVKRAVPLPQDQIAAVRLPPASKVVLVHADQEEQVYP